MPRDLDRRSFMKAAGATAGALALGPQITAARRSEDQFIVDTSNVNTSAFKSWTIRHDLSEVDLAVVRADESDIPDFVDYVRDIEMEVEVPAGPITAEDVDVDLEEVAADAAPDSHLDEPYVGLQWDKLEQRVHEAHKMTTGHGTRVAVIDTGIYEDHPDLARNVNEGLSKNFTADDEGPFAVAMDHGTHVSGIIGARNNGSGVIGHAPNAELLSLRVFSSEAAGSGDVLAAVLYAANKNCDVANLSLGFPPLVDLDDDSDPDAGGAILNVPQSSIDFLRDAYSRVGRYAVENGCLPVAAAGNDAYNLTRELKDYFYNSPDWDPGPDGVLDDGDLVTIPAEAEGFMSVAATGPIGFIWGDNDSDSNLALELPTTEPAVYTNFGSDAVDVSASGGNFEIDAYSEYYDGDSTAPAWYYDLVFNTIFTGDALGDTDTRSPTYGWVAGTSMACPTVAGLAALVKSKHPQLDPMQIRRTIEETAVDLPVGLGFSVDGTGETAATTFRSGYFGPYLNNDGTPRTIDYDGDALSHPNLNSQRPDISKYRGHGHIYTLAALKKTVRNGRGNSNAGSGETSGGDAPGGDGPMGDGPHDDGGGAS